MAIQEDVLLKVKMDGSKDAADGFDGIGKSSEETATKVNKTVSALAALRKEAKEAKSTMLTAAEGTIEYNNAMQKAAEVADKMRDINDKVKASQNDVGVVAKNVAGTVSGLGAAFTTAQGAVALFGLDSEDLQKTMVKLQATLSVTQGIANFFDAFDSMKDLFNAVKLRILGMVAAKQIDTVVTAENTAANVAEGVAIEAVGVASKTTAASIMAALAPYALIAAAIALVVAGVILLVKKLTEVPQELKIKIEIDEQSIKKMEEDYAKVRLFAIDYNKAVREGNKERIKLLEEVALKEYGLHKDRLKMIADNVDNWKIAFSDYLKIAQDTYYNEFLAKKKAEVQYKIESAKANEDSVLSNIKSQLKAQGKNDEYVKNFINSWKTGTMEAGRVTSFGMQGLRGIWNDAVENATNAYKEMSDLNKIPFKNVYSKESNDEVTKAIEKKAADAAAAQKKIDDEAAAKAKIKAKERLAIAKMEAQQLADAKINTEIKAPDINLSANVKIPGFDKAAAALDKIKNGPGKGLNDFIKQSQLGINDQLEQYNEMYSTGVLTYQQYLDKRTELLKAANLNNVSISIANTEEMAKIDSEAFQKSVDMALTIMDQMSSITDSISDMYDTRMKKTNQYYDNEAERINNSLMSEEDKNAALAELDAARYEALKKDFEKQKKLKIASAMINMLSGSIAIWSNPATIALGPIGYPIVAGLEEAALLATTYANIKAINAEQLDAPTSSKSISSSSSSAATTKTVESYTTALMPTQSMLTSNADNLNMMNSSSTPVVNVVKVADINQKQKTVSVRDTYAGY